MPSPFQQSYRVFMKETRRCGTGPRSRRTERAPLFSCSLLAHSLLLLVAFWPPALRADSGQPKNVLVLYSFSKREAFDSLKPLEATIRSHVSTPVNFYVEFLESQRFGSRDYEHGLSETLRDSYAKLKPDLLVVAAYPALRFAAEFRDRMFPGVPIVFVSVAPGRVQGHKLWPGVTGITIPVDVGGTLDLALRLNPDTRNVAVVAGNSEFERYWLDVTHQQLQLRADQLKVIDLVGLPTDRLLLQVSTLPAHTVVFFQLIPQDAAQPVIGTYDVLTAIAQRFPTYCIHNYCFDHGAIGGSYPDSDEQGVKGGELAARVLLGEKPEDIPVIHGSLTRVQVDWRQLRRWNIAESALPPGTIFLYRQPTVWERYQKYMLAGVAVILLQALLIGGLLWQRARKKSATEALQRLSGRLIHAQEEERAHIARELHDDFSQRLAVQCIELTQLRKSLPESAIEERAATLKMLKETKEMSADMRLLSHQLHSSRLELAGLVAALRGLCDEISDKYPIEVHFVDNDLPQDLSKDLELCLFRIAQEALLNIVKHSEAKSALVEVGATANYISLRISDEGIGFDPDPKNLASGIGLINMHERLRLAGGRLTVSSELMRGTEILAEIPLTAISNKGQVPAYAAGGMTA